MADEKRLIDVMLFVKTGWHLVRTGKSNEHLASMSLADVPTVDAVEVVHARWENGHCTNCKQNAEVQSIGFNCTGGIRIDYKETNYCPNCGAKMDGGNEDG